VAEQSFPANRYELLVVNNDPTDARVRQQVSEVRGQLFRGRERRLRFVECLFEGLSMARNAGISEARGEIVCFLDDDAVAHPCWLASLDAAYQKETEAGVVGGQVLLRPPDPRPGALQPGWERYWSHFSIAPGHPRAVESWWELPWGANWTARRRALLEIGGFRARYGRRGQDYSGGEELVAARLIQSLGYRVVLAPDARVWHDVDPRRFTFHHVRKTIIAGTLVQYRAQRDLYLPPDGGALQTLRRLLDPRFDQTVGAAPLARLRHWLYRREALGRRLLAELADLLRRLRPGGVSMPYGRTGDGPRRTRR
jgi:GT2 family glycosyltransferase